MLFRFSTLHCLKKEIEGCFEIYCSKCLLESIVWFVLCIYQEYDIWTVQRISSGACPIMLRKYSTKVGWLKLLRVLLMELYTRATVKANLKSLCIVETNCAMESNYSALFPLKVYQYACVVLWKGTSKTFLLSKTGFIQKLQHFMPEDPAEFGTDGRVVYYLYCNPANPQSIYFLGTIGTHWVVLLRLIGTQECQKCKKWQNGVLQISLPNGQFEISGLP